jgi:hypothetical protein
MASPKNFLFLTLYLTIYLSPRKDQTLYVASHSNGLLNWQVSLASQVWLMRGLI